MDSSDRLIQGGTYIKSGRDNPVVGATIYVDGSLSDDLPLDTHI